MPPPPPAATHEDTVEHVDPHADGTAKGVQAKAKSLTTPSPPVYSDPYEARQKGKEKLAGAFRIFAKYGFDEGAGQYLFLFSN